MDLHGMLRTFQDAGQPVTPFLDGRPASDLDADRLLAAGQRCSAKLRPEPLDGDRLAIVQVSHPRDVEIRSPHVAPATVVLSGSNVTHVWLLDEAVPGWAAESLGRILEGRFGGAAWRTTPTSSLAIPGTFDDAGLRPVPVIGGGSGDLIPVDALLLDPSGREAATGLLRTVGA